MAAHLRPAIPYVALVVPRAAAIAALSVHHAHGPTEGYLIKVRPAGPTSITSTTRRPYLIDCGGDSAQSPYTRRVGS